MATLLAQRDRAVAVESRAPNEAVRTGRSNSRRIPRDALPTLKRGDGS